MDKKIEYSTISEQIELLRSKDLIIDDVDFASEQLKQFGYYNIINSYKAPYQKDSDGKKVFIPGTSFEQIFSLFTFDHTLRNAIMSSMLALEEHIKAAAAEVLSQSFGTDQNNYLAWENFRDRRRSQERFGLKGTLEKLQKDLLSDKNPIKYYRETYGIVHPWILFKGSYFSTVVNFVRLFKEPQKKYFVKLLYNCSDELCANKDVKTLLFDTLSICLEYRNLAAHGGRVYNYTPNAEVRLDDISSVIPLDSSLSDLYSWHGLCLLLNLLDIFPYKEPRDIIDRALTSELNRHLDFYERDLDFLGEVLNLNIFTESDDCILIEGKEYPIKTRKQSGIPGMFIIDAPEELREMWETIPVDAPPDN